MQTAIPLLLGVLVIVLLITGPTLWRDWQEERARKQR